MSKISGYFSIQVRPVKKFSIENSFPETWESLHPILHEGREEVALHMPGHIVNIHVVT